MVQGVMHDARHRRCGPFAALCLAAALAAVPGCAPEEPPEGTEADQVGVAAQCQADPDCEVEADSDGPEFELQCLTNFKGGYCGVVDCMAHEDCPLGSACVAHEDGRNYCFRICQDKSECNINRDLDNEANCSANITWVGDDVGKACVPPSG
jgi:hypothetical protein